MPKPIGGIRNLIEAIGRERLSLSNITEDLLYGKSQTDEHTDQV